MKDAQIHADKTIVRQDEKIRDEEELHELKKYRVQNYLNQLIREYKSNRGMTTDEAI